jgi:DNA-binding response OmpR family regulator
MEKILIIEDDKFLRELIVRKLNKEDFEVSEAVDGEEGIKKIIEEKPDLILLDLILPGIDGFEVLARMKKESSLSSIPVIILSNLGQKDDVEKGLKMGAIDYLIKAHFTPGEIIEKIKVALK